MDISQKRLKELERAEQKLMALEAGGVSCWAFYDEALKGYWAENDEEEKKDKLFKDKLFNQLDLMFNQFYFRDG